MKKIYLIPLLAVFGIALAFAGVYVVNSFTLQSDVYEPFDVEYAILGDAGNYDGTPTCAEYSTWESSVWTDYSELGEIVDVDGLYAGEARKFCVRINNLGEGDVPYVIESSIVTGSGNYEDCAASFPEETLTGTATGSQVITDGLLIEVADDAPVVNDCQIEISVARGTLE